MKKILILLIGVLSISCNQSKKESSNTKTAEVTENLDDFDWLLGKWERLNEEEGMRTFENWEKVSDAEYSGIGFSMQAGDTIKQEKMRLINTSGKWNLTVKVPSEKESTAFKMINYSENEFTCENNEIDFPNKIRYWKNGDKINALVSNAEMQIPFEFEKRKEHK